MSLFKPSTLLAWCFISICARATESEVLKTIWHHDSGAASVGMPMDISSQTGGTPKKIQDKKDRACANVTTTAPQQTRRKLSAKILDQDLLETLDEGAEGRCNFQGRHLRVAVSPQPPFVDCLQNLYGDWLCNGSNIELIRVLERRFNFKSDWIVIANHYQEDSNSGHMMSRPWGQPSTADNQIDQVSKSIATQAKMSAVVGMVAAGRASLSANGFMRTIDRSTSNLVVSEPFDQFRFHLLLSKQARDHDHIFIKPFQPSAWLAILCSACLVVPIFYIINTTSAHYVLEYDEHLKRVNLFDCWRYYKGRIKSWLARNPVRRLRSTSLTPSDLSFERRVDSMLMLQPKAFPSERAFGDHTVCRTAMTPDYALAIDRGMPVIMKTRPISSLVTSRRRTRLARRQWAVDRKHFKKMARRRTRTGFFNVAYIIWYVVASLSNQGGETEDLPRANSTRILIAFWWLYLIVICAIHSGILTAILTFPKQYDFIDNYLNLKPSELVSLHLAVDMHSELAHLLVNSDNLHKSSLQLLKEHNIPVNYVNFQRNRQRILDSVQVGRMTLIEEKSTIKQIITREYYDSKRTRCLFKSSRHPMDVIPMSLVLSAQLQPNCIRQIDLTLARIMQSGLAMKWRRKFESPGNDCLNSVEINAGDVDKIELRHVALAFWLLACGAGVGVVFLIGEVIWLFTIGDEDDDGLSSVSETSAPTYHSFSASSSSSSSSIATATSNESDRVRLGFRRALLPPDYQMSTIRSLRAKQLDVNSLLRKTKRNQKRRIGSNQRHRHHLHHEHQAPKIIFSVDLKMNDNATSSGDEEDHSVVVDDSVGLREVSEFHARHLKEKRSKRSIKEAERRAKRIQRTVQLVKRVHGGHIYSDRLKKRVRRLSHSVAGRFSLDHHQKRSNSNNLARNVKLRGRAGSVMQLGAFNCRVVPIL